MCIGSVMTEIMPDADTEYMEVAEEYEEDVLVVGVSKAFTNFLLSGSFLRQARCITPTFQHLLCLFVH
jgi:hypothetical protein